MKNIALTLLLAGSIFTLAACESSNTYDAGASYASGRTAGEADGAPMVKKKKAEKVFNQKMYK